MPPLSFEEAREAVLGRVPAARPAHEQVALAEACGRVLARDIAADRDYPPFNRSMRDGFAVHARDLPGSPQIIGEVRAGEVFSARVGPNQAVSIMTGAPVPEGADSVVMIEHGFNHAIEPGANISPRGCEALAGAVILKAGTRLDYTAVGALATAGHSSVKVFARPEIAIIATGDEIVEVSATPLPHQIRNSNAQSLAAQVRRAGGIPRILPIAPDELNATREIVEQALHSNLVLLSGGVSAGKYDVVEPALAQFNAEFFFDRVRIQPGAPLVFGSARNRFFFGLPGNPASTMVCFELFARSVIRRLSGEQDATLPFFLAQLTNDFRHKAGLTRFLPAHLEDTRITPIAWQGSGDIPSLARANAWLVADHDHPRYAAGDIIRVLAK